MRIYLDTRVLKIQDFDELIRPRNNIDLGLILYTTNTMCKDAKLGEALLSKEFWTRDPIIETPRFTDIGDTPAKTTQSEP